VQTQKIRRWEVSVKSELSPKSAVDPTDAGDAAPL
jgi:hypothetical protein